MLKRYEPKFPYNTVNMMEEIEDGDYVKFTDVKINSIIEQMKKIPQKKKEDCSIILKKSHFKMLQVLE